MRQASKHELVMALRECYWAASRADGKRLAPYLPELVPALEREGALHLAGEELTALL